LTVTYTANPTSRLYGAGNPVLSGSTSAVGLVNTDTLASVTSGAAAFTTTATTTTPVGNYAIIGAGLTGASSNYSYSFVQAPGNASALRINPTALTLTIAADAQTKLYGAPLPNLTYLITSGSLVGSDTLSGALATAATQSSNVGVYAITQGTLNNSNYAITYIPANLTVIPATLTYSANTASRFYGATNPTLSGSVTGFVLSDTLGNATTGTANFTTTASTTSNVGRYAITGSGLSANNGNYVFVQGAGNATALTVNPAALTVTYAANPISRLYGAANPSLTGSETAVGLVNSDTLASVTSGTAAFTTTATTASNVGSYGIIGAGLAGNSGNYSISFVQAAANVNALTVTPANLTVTYTANPISRLYGMTNPVLSGTTSAVGLVNGDTLSGTAAFTTTATSASNIGSYAITGTGLNASSNYTASFVQAAGNATALTITPATLTYAANAASRFYGSSNPAFTGSVTGFVLSDTLANATTGSASFTSTAGVTSNIGSYAITGSGLTANNGNYVFVQAAGNATALTINPAALSVLANPLSRTYGGSNPALTYVATGLVNGDTLSGALTTAATSSSNVGTYAITQGTLAASPNYTLSYTGANLSITPAALTITYNANPVTSIYGSTPSGLSGSQSASGLVNGDTLAGVTTGTASYTTAATSSSNVGSYAISGAGLSGSSSNYTTSFVQAAGNATALTINPAHISVTALGGTSVYGTSPSNPGLSASGLVLGQSVSVLTGLSNSFGITSTSSVGSSPYTLTVAGTLTNANYTIDSRINGLWTITPASLTVITAGLIGSTSKTYDGTTAATLTSANFKLSGFVNSDGASVNQTAGIYASANAGTGIVVTASLSPSNFVAIGTTNLSNYTLPTSASGAIGIINPAALTITYVANPTSRLYGVANPVFTGIETISGLVGSDTLAGVTNGTALFTSPATITSLAGSYAINGSGLTGKSGNYSYTFKQALGNATALTIKPVNSCVGHDRDDCHDRDRDGDHNHDRDHDSDHDRH
jgi:hypothetical protein